MNNFFKITVEFDAVINFYTAGSKTTSKDHVIYPNQKIGSEKSRDRTFLKNAQNG